MTGPKYSVDQKVKFKGDPDLKAGKVLGVTWNSDDGFIYRIASRFYDASVDDMVEGHRIGKEDEIEAVK